jgi:microcystin-dependent protein
MAVGRVIAVHKNRLGCSVSTTVVGDNAVKLVPVDAAVVDFDESGGQFLHQPTGDIYAYTSADIDLETITLTAGLPSGKTLTLDDALYVYPRSDDFFADVAIDDVGTDVVAARVPQMLRTILEEGHGSGQVVRVTAGAEEWHVTELVGGTPTISTGNFETGDWKICGWDVPSGVLVDGGWLKADGTAVSRATYAALFNRYQTLYGAGNGTTTFNLPDARGRAIFGAGTIIAPGATDGNAESARGPGHKHGIVSGGGHNHTIPSVSHSGASNAPGTGALDKVALLAGTTGGSHDHTGSVGTVGDHAHGGETQGGLTSSDPFSYIGANILVKT